jgi:hypothetical protein
MSLITRLVRASVRSRSQAEMRAPTGKRSGEPTKMIPKNSKIAPKARSAIAAGDTGDMVPSRPAGGRSELSHCE